jgi:hypothetical protein
MALNSPLSPNGIPFRLNEEFILLERPGMDIQIKMNGRSTIAGKGRVYLTTGRMVFVNDAYLTDKFKSFDMPIAFLVKPKFEQPIFGANYLQFTVKPISHTLPTDAEVKLWFSKGGCERFLKIYEHVSKQVYEQKRTQRMNNNLYNSWAQGYFQKNNAFVDPTDPTVIITEQPPVFNPQNQYIGENIYVNPNTNYPDLGPNVQPPTPQPQQHYPSNDYQPQVGGQSPYNQPPPPPSQNPYSPHHAPQSPYQQGYQQQPNFQPQQAPFPQTPTHVYGQPPTGYAIPGQPPQQPAYPQQPQFPQYPGHPQQPNQFAQNPQYQQVPNMQNPLPVVNQNQQPNNAGYYFGLWGPQLEHGRQ